MVKVQLWQCAWRTTIIIYSDNIISCKNTYNVSIKSNEWSHSSLARNDRKTSKCHNQQWWQWNDAIVLGEKQWCFIVIILLLGNILPM